MATKWGIIGVGESSKDFVLALKSQDPDEHKIVTTASSSVDDVKQFAEKHGVENSYSSYEEMLKNPDIDIVFIGFNPPEHHRLSMLCLNAGKSVLCSVPVAMEISAAREVFSLAKEKKLFFMEAFWTRFFPVYEKVRKELTSGTLGDVINIQASVCRNDIADQTVSALHEVGAITIMLADMIFKEKPLKIQASGNLNSHGKDTVGAVTLTYRDGRIASLVYSSVAMSLNNCFVINATQGSMKVESPCWCPTQLTTSSGEFEFPLPECSDQVTSLNGEGLVYQQNAVRQCLLDGKTECPDLTLSNSENIHYILDTVSKELGIKRE